MFVLIPCVALTLVRMGEWDLILYENNTELVVGNNHLDCCDVSWF